MKKILMLLVMIGLIVSPIAFADMEAIYVEDKAISQRGWNVFGADDDIDAAYELITELDTTFAQLAVEDTIEILSASAADITQTVTVSGINSAGNRVIESIALDTTAGTTAVTSSTTFRYIDQVEVDIECAGAITIRRATGDTFITSIPIGILQATMVQHFNGEKDTYITGWRASVTSTTGTVLFELRLYLDDADCLDTGDGYRVLDEIQLNNVHSTELRPFDQPIRCNAGSWIAVYGIGGAANSDGSISLQGFDSL